MKTRARPVPAARPGTRGLRTAIRCSMLPIGAVPGGDGDASGGKGMPPIMVPRTDDDWKGGDSADTPAGAAALGDGDADAAGKGAGPVAQRSRPLRKSLDKSATSKRADSPESRGAGEELKRGAEEEGRGRFASGGASAGGAERTDSRRWEGRGGGGGRPRWPPAPSPALQRAARSTRA